MHKLNHNGLQPNGYYSPANYGLLKKLWLSKSWFNTRCKVCNGKYMLSPASFKWAFKKNNNYPTWPVLISRSISPKCTLHFLCPLSQWCGSPHLLFTNAAVSLCPTLHLRAWMQVLDNHHRQSVGDFISEAHGPVDKCAAVLSEKMSHRCIRTTWVAARSHPGQKAKLWNKKKRQTSK